MDLPLPDLGYPGESGVVVQKSGENSITLVQNGEEGPEMQYHVTHLGWGDFNHDGTEDLLFFYCAYSLQGTMRFYHNVILTRFGPKDPLHVVEY